MRYTGEKTLLKARKKFGYGNDDELPTSSVNPGQADSRFFGSSEAQ